MVRATRLPGTVAGWLGLGYLTVLLLDATTRDTFTAFPAAFLGFLLVGITLGAARDEARAQRFDEFGCTLCHQIVPGKMGLTELGSKLTHMHLGCVDVEKTLASK